MSKKTYSYVLGEYSRLKEVSLFVSYIPLLDKNNQTDYKEEYWLEETGMREDYYKYMKTYIKQVETKTNPFATVIEVHSNIKNGVGILPSITSRCCRLFPPFVV